MCEKTRAFEDVSEIDLQGIIKEIFSVPDSFALSKSLLANAAANDSDCLVKLEFFHYLNKKLDTYDSCENDAYLISEKYFLRMKIEEYLKKLLENENDIHESTVENFYILNYIGAGISLTQRENDNKKKMMSKIDSDQLIAFLNETNFLSSSLQHE